MQYKLIPIKLLLWYSSDKLWMTTRKKTYRDMQIFETMKEREINTTVDRTWKCTHWIEQCTNRLVSQSCDDKYTPHDTCDYTLSCHRTRKLGVREDNKPLNETRRVSHLGAVEDKPPRRDSAADHESVAPSHGPKVGYHSLAPWRYPCCPQMQLIPTKLRSPRRGQMNPNLSSACDQCLWLHAHWQIVETVPGC